MILQPGLAVYSPKRRQTYLMVGCLGVAVTCAVMLALARSELGLVMKIIMWAGFVGFGFGGLQLLRRVLRPRPALIVDEEGLLDQSSFASAGRIPWSDIADVRLVSYPSQLILAIDVKDPEPYLARANPLKRQALRVNRSLAGTPFIIPFTALQVVPATLMAEVDKHRGRSVTADPPVSA